MTSIEELRELIANNAKMSRENLDAIRASRTESEKRWAEAEKVRAEARAESEKRWEGAEKARAEADKRWAEGQKRWDKGLAELKRLREESEQRHAEWREESERRQVEWREELLASRIDSDRIFTSLYQEIRWLRRDVGQLGNQFGLYTEAMFLPSLDRILREDFGMQVVEPHAIGKTKDGEELELDVLAHANDTLDLVVDVEIKTQLRQDGIDQILDHLHRFAKFFPEHRGKKAYGILGAIRLPPEVKAKALKAGIYVAAIRDDVFELLRPEGFEPRAFPI